MSVRNGVLVCILFTLLSTANARQLLAVGAQDACVFTLTSTKLLGQLETVKTSLTDAIASLTPANATVLVESPINEVAVTFAGNATAAKAFCEVVATSLSLSSTLFGETEVEGPHLASSQRIRPRACTYSGECSWWWYNCRNQYTPSYESCYTSGKTCYYKKVKGKKKKICKDKKSCYTVGASTDCYCAYDTSCGK